MPSFHRALRLLPAALALACACAPAQAQNRFAAAIGNLDYTLTDLAPGDGVAPDASFDTPFSGYLRDGVDVVRDGHAPVKLAEDRWIRDPAVFNRDLPYLHGTGAYLGDDGLVAAISLSPLPGASIRAYQSTAVSRYVSLAPHTAIAITVDALVDLVLDPAHLVPGNDGGPFHGGGFGAADVSLNASDGTFESGQMSGGVSDDPAQADDTVLHLAETYTLRWRNDTDQWGYGWISMSSIVVAVMADGTVPAVPEPSTWAMLGAGCGLLAVRGRRRKNTGHA